MKSLNSPARKDIIKFPTAKFAFLPPAHLFVPSSSGSADTSSLCIPLYLSLSPSLSLHPRDQIIKSDK